MHGSTGLSLPGCTTDGLASSAGCRHRGAGWHLSSLGLQYSISGAPSLLPHLGFLQARTQEGKVVLGV